MIDLILGTAGHIDHGKTALVKALTGVDTDRLPEEKRRGITIELGFAELPLDEYRLGLVDVPGHERFIRNMLAGASGIDMALLVVAADDSVKPQTREHLEILRLLRLSAGVIALTKCDLPNRDWIDLVEEEVRELVADTFLANAPIVRTSAANGMGLDALRSALAAAAKIAAAAADRRSAGPFRMAIDRSFTVAGIGTVVTGSVQSGRATVGDELAIEPGSLRTRARGMQNHGRPVNEVHRGQRAAINLAGVHHEQLSRGQELAAPGHLVPGSRLSVRLNMLPQSPRPLKHRSRVRLHVGTAELTAAVALVDRDRLAPGDSAYAQLTLSQPAVTVWGQPFIIRTESPAMTIGGGQVLDPNASRLRRGDEQSLALLDALSAEDSTRRVSAVLYCIGWQPWQPRDLARKAGIDDATSLCQALQDRGELVEMAVSPSRTITTHRRVIEELTGRIVATLGKMHAQYPLELSFDRARLASQFSHLRRQSGSDALLSVLLARMAADRKVVLTDSGIALAGRGPKLSPQQHELLDNIVAVYHQAGYQPPTVQEIKNRTVRNEAAVPQLIRVAAADGRLVQISSEYYLHADWERQLRETLTARLAGGEGLTVSQIREILGTTRKYAVPLCEYLDRIGLTRREGDVRTFGKQHHNR